VWCVFYSESIVRKLFEIHSGRRLIRWCQAWYFCVLEHARHFFLTPTTTVPHEPSRATKETVLSLLMIDAHHWSELIFRSWVSGELSRRTKFLFLWRICLDGSLQIRAFSVSLEVLFPITPNNCTSRSMKKNMVKKCFVSVWTAQNWLSIGYILLRSVPCAWRRRTWKVFTMWPGESETDHEQTRKIIT
jgi:hypothetical protein